METKVRKLIPLLHKTNGIKAIKLYKLQNVIHIVYLAVPRSNGI